ncbi:MAG: CehA/McbA family metallohydrolase [Anaerolineales bacterium]|nr:CehA/McbA family metallohydrolase [Anaerolineales bacterium]
METLSRTFEHSLTDLDSKHNLAHTVEIPAGTRQLDVTLDFEPALVDGFHNMVTLTLIGPSGFRGAGHRHGNRHDVRLTATQATPGYLAGEITAGAWQVVIDTHLIVPGTPCSLRLQVVGQAVETQSPSVPTRTAPRPPRAPKGAGWYRGDLHAHTVHSDAVWSAASLADDARARGLDFVTLSDHNTTSGLAEMAEACGDDLVLVPALELTTFWGHALALGLREWVDWRITPHQRVMPTIAEEVRARGGLFVIAHPRSIGDPHCTGCAWVHPDMQPGPARIVEVWNGPWTGESRNEEALAQAFVWLNAGCRLVLTAGTDHHGDPDYGPDLGFNVVMADRLTAESLLAAIRVGHLYVSSGPMLDFEAVIDAESYVMGDSASPAKGAPIQLIASWRDCPPDASIVLVVDGVPAGEARAGVGSTHVWGRSGGDAHWCVLSVRAADGRLLALTNPIFLDGR